MSVLLSRLPAKEEEQQISPNFQFYQILPRKGANSLRDYGHGRNYDLPLWQNTVAGIYFKILFHSSPHETVQQCAPADF